jgi:predicted transcriptional regulator
MKPKPFKPSRLELELLEPLWALGTASIREIQESLPEKDRPEYTTVQTIIYRLEEKGAVERIKKIGNAHIFRPLVTRQSAVAGLVEDFLSLFAGSHEPLVTHLVETGRISSAELKQVENLLKSQKKP